MGDSNSLPSEIDLLKQILEVLQNSDIAAEERGQDGRSRFWAAYKKVSSEYDGDMLERCNGNMDIVLIFAGLFSAVNTAFIIAMQPNPADTTNTLLVQLIQTLDGSPAVQSTILSAPTGYSSAYVWTQALAYASLIFGLLAAFGAVLGKQWLGYYKANCYGRGSLEARCKQRHRKFQTLQNWKFQKVLYSFPVLLQISLLLFALSLGAAMWIQHQAISILIIAIAGLGVFCYIFTIVISVAFPDCPFQTPVSLAIRAIIRYFRKREGFRIPDVDSTTSAMKWILKTSTNPDIVRSAVELMRNMSKKSNVNIVPVCEEVRDMFKACFDHHGLTHRDSALGFGQALIHFSWNNDHARQMLCDSTEKWDLWGSWRALYLPWELERCLTWYDRMKDSETDNVALRGYAKADLRNALRMVVTIGIDGFTYPDDEQLIWNDQFRLHSFASEEDIRRFIDQLISYMKHFHDIGDFEVAGDALLLASGIATIPHSDSVQLSDSAVALNVVNTITSLPVTTSNPRWNRVILGAIRRFVNWREYLPYDIPSKAVLTALCWPVDTTLSPDDQYGSWFTNATDLFSWKEWPKDHHLKRSSLPEMQQLVLRALRVLPTPKVDNAANYIPYCRALSRLMGANHPELRHFALHTASNDKQELALIGVAGFDTSQRDMVFSELSPALLTIANNSSTPMKDLTEYLHIISTLARNSGWRDRLMMDGHVGRCITLITDDLSEEACFYLAQFFLRVAPPTQDISCDTITHEQRWLLTKTAWHFIGRSSTQIDDAVDIISSLVKSTEICMLRDFSKDDLRLFRDCMGNVVQRLQQERWLPTIIIEVTRLKNMVEGRAK